MVVWIDDCANLQSWSELLGHFTSPPIKCLCRHLPLPTPNIIIFLMHTTKPQCVNFVLGGGGDGVVFLCITLCPYAVFS